MSKQISELKGKIGLEIHSYVITREKLFCKCRASRERGLKANTLICPICTGQPGAKPMLANKEAVKKAILIGAMLNCKINHDLKWQRKHYDWPDMPKGYQNTISGAGVIPVGVNGEFLGIRISSMHLEEDPASWEPETGRVDYNRSGLPLVEIITMPDFSNSDEVVEWLKKLVHNLSYLKAVDPNAGIKVDVNVNLENVNFSSPTIAKQQAIAGLFENGRKKTERVEIKNISSIEDIGKAIDYELERQSKEGGNRRETRRYDSLKGKTLIMREKEGQDDYRFIVDPDLQDIVISDKMIELIKEEVPESPEKKLDKLIKKYKIGEKDANVLAKNIDIVEFYEKIVDSGINPEFALPWVTIELLRYLNYNQTSLDKTDLKVEHFVSLLKLVRDRKITVLQGKQILNKFYPKSFDPSKEIKGKEKITSEKELEKFVEKVIEKNKKAVEDYKNGEEKSFNFLMGEIMKSTDKRADFAVARKVLQKLLNPR